MHRIISDLSVNFRWKQKTHNLFATGICLQDNHPNYFRNFDFSVRKCDPTAETYIIEF